MERDSIKSFENLCKIFEMRIKLDKEKNIDTPEDVLINYEKYSKKIDNIYNKEFKEEIKPLIKVASTLEKEEERLRKLIKLLEDRNSKREELEDRFYIATGRYIKDLQIVVSESELNENKDRLELVTRYLDTDKEIKAITESIAKLRNSLEEEEEKKEEYLRKNEIMEEELKSSFLDAINSDSYYDSLNIDNLDETLVTIIEKVKETSETLEVTKDSVESLEESGISDDYLSYIEEAEKNYYIWKNREIITKIYEKVVEIKEEFNDIISKREAIDNLVSERSSLRVNLEVNENDELYAFSNLLNDQMNSLDGEKEVLENISNYTSRIRFKEERLDELEQDINSVEILSLLKEYSLIDTYESEHFDIEDEEIEENEYIDEEYNDEEYSEEDFDEESESGEELEPVEPTKEEVVLDEIDPYRIVEIKDYPKTLNIGLAKLKAENVREKINKKLNPEMEALKFVEMPNVLEKEQVPEEIKVPTWEVPTSSEEKAPKEREESIPMWDMTSSKTSNEPVWQTVTDELIKEKGPNLPVWNEVEDSKTEEFPSPEINSNLFWTPVDNSNIDTNNLNMPTMNENGNFDFPDINN